MMTSYGNTIIFDLMYPIPMLQYFYTVILQILFVSGVERSADLVMLVVYVGGPCVCVCKLVSAV